MWQIKKIIKYEHNFDLIAVLAVIVFLVLAIFVPNVKTFFVLSFALFSFLTFRYSFIKAFIYSTIPLSYISLSQNHPILVIPAKAIVSNQYWEGRHLVLDFSPFFFIASIALLTLPFWLKKLKQQFEPIKLINYEKMLIVLFGCGLLSASYASLMSGLSIFSVYNQFLSVLWIWYTSRLIHGSNKANQQRIFLTLFLVIASLITYESLIVLKQSFSQAPIGLAIEKYTFATAFGAGADESGGGFRPFGLQAHPNGLANKQLIMAFSVWLLFCKIDSKNQKNKSLYIKNILTFVLILATINIILSLSRAAVIALFLALLFLFYRHQQQFKLIVSKIEKFISQIPLRNKLVLFMLLFLLVFKLSDRLLNSIYSFSEFGGVSTRLVQYTEAIEVFKKSPVFGIGDEMFIPTSYQLFPKGVMTYFPENVHNGYLLFIIERGLLGLVAYLIFLFLVLQKIQQSPLNKQTKSVVYSGLIATFVMMFFHPERNFLSSFMLLTMAVNHLNYEKK